jgi:hypothetical protein
VAKTVIIAKTTKSSTKVKEEEVLGLEIVESINIVLL